MNFGRSILIESNKKITNALIRADIRSGYAVLFGTNTYCNTFKGAIKNLTEKRIFA